MNYNQIKHLELFKRLQECEKEVKSLYKQNKNEYLELLDY